MHVNERRRQEAVTCRARISSPTCRVPIPSLTCAVRICSPTGGVRISRHASDTSSIRHRQFAAPQPSGGGGGGGDVATCASCSAAESQTSLFRIEGANDVLLTNTFVAQFFFFFFLDIAVLLGTIDDRCLCSALARKASLANTIVFIFAQLALTTIILVPQSQKLKTHCKILCQPFATQLNVPSLLQTLAL